MEVRKILNEKLSRRGLIKGAAGAAAVIGVSALTSGGMDLFSRAEAKEGKII